MLLVILVTAIVLVGILLAFGTVYLVVSNRNQVPSVSTPQANMNEAIAALDLPTNGTFWDLGCGDGGVLAAAIAHSPGLLVKGIENNPALVLLAKMKVGRGAQVVLGQIEQVEFGSTDRVYVYLSPKFMAYLEPRFNDQLPKGARIVSQQFPLPNRTPDRVLDLAAGKAHAEKLYIYDY
jgi:hypothetical protein